MPKTPRKQPASHAVDPMRRAELAKIHIAKKELYLDDIEYEEIIRRITNGRKVRSSNLNQVERRALLSEFQRFGWKPKPPADAAATAAPIPRQSAKRLFWRIRKLAGDRGEPYLNGMAKGMFNLDSIQFATDQQLHSILAALEIDARRHRNQGVKADV